MPERPIAEPPSLWPVSRRHLDLLADDVGIMQHAIGKRPDPAHGYCTDDVARALQVDLLHQRTLGWIPVAASARRNLRFLVEAFDERTGRFRNFRNLDRSWLDKPASEDSQGRAMHALGDAIATAPDAMLVEEATSLFTRALPAAQQVTAFRARASVLLGCDAVTGAAPSEPTARAYRLLAEGLGRTFSRPTRSDWPWPDQILTYENALPARALIVAGAHHGWRPMLKRGLGVLDWLIASQTGARGQFSPVGNGWWARGGVKSRFDQQPIEATALLLAAGAAHDRTGAPQYRDAMESAFRWFLGANDLGLAVAEPERGASYDGLTPRGVNANQGAESTMMWLMALERIRDLREPAREPARRGSMLVALSTP